MKLANINGRSSLVTGSSSAIDVHTATRGLFSPDPQEVYSRWQDFQRFFAGRSFSSDIDFERSDLCLPVPSPHQIFAVGLNYEDHAKESGLPIPSYPTVFPKFVSSLTGPDVEVRLPPDSQCDWEVELVVVVGKRAHNVCETKAWDHVAGLTVGQDLTDRKRQFSGPTPQFGLSKSFPNFGPIGPWVSTVDEFADPDDLDLGCALNGERVQSSRTRNMVFPIPRVISYLSSVVTLLPGDLIFTGTPAGVGAAREPSRSLQCGDELVSWVGGLGEIRQRMVQS